MPRTTKEAEIKMYDRKATKSDVLTAKEAAEYLGVSLITLQKMDKKLRPARTTPGGKRRYRQRWLDEYLEDSKRR